MRRTKIRKLQDTKQEGNKEQKHNNKNKHKNKDNTVSDHTIESKRKYTHYWCAKICDGLRDGFLKPHKALCA